MSLSIAMAVAALVLISVMPGQDAGDYNRKIIANNAKLEKVAEAVRSFMTLNGRRPCPADGKYVISDANFGVEAADPGSCQGGTPSAPLGLDTHYTDCSGGGCIVGGAIPTKTLGLPDDYAFDAFGHRFIYLVDIRATKNSTCLATSTGDIAIVSATGGTTLQRTMYAYISAGQSGDGAWPLQGGATRINTTNPDHDMETDAGFGGAYSWTTNGTLVQKARIGNFDDMAWYRADDANTCALGAFAAIGHCNTAGAPNGTGPLDSSFSPTMLPGSGPNNTMTAYASSTSNCASTHTLTCTNGQLKCDGDPVSLGPCKYSSCDPSGCPTASSATPVPGPLDASFSPSSLPGVGPNNTHAGYANSSGTCTQNTVTCNSGTLSCSNGGSPLALNQCEFSNCVPPPNCSTASLGGGTFSPATIASGAPAISTWPNSSASSCGASHQLTCNSGVLYCDGSTTLTNCQYTSCTETCATSPPGPLDATFSPSTLPGSGPFSIVNAYASSTCTKNTLTCTNGALSCSNGGSPLALNQCQFSDHGACLAASGASTGPGYIYVVEYYNNRVQVFDSSGNSKGIIGTTGPGNGELNAPKGIALDSGGNVWVTDTGNNRVEEFSGSGNYLGQFGSAGVGDGYFSNPEGIAVDSNQHIWVVDNGNNRVQEFDTNGNHLLTIPSGCSNPIAPACTASAATGSFDQPADIAVDNNNNIWVVDNKNLRVQEFNNAGAPQGQIPPLGVPAFGCQTTTIPSCPGGANNGEFFLLYGIAVDSGNNVWVMDENAGTPRIQEFNNAGSYQKQIDITRGSLPGQTKLMREIAIDGTGNIWMTDGNDDGGGPPVGNARVQEFSSATGSYENLTFGSYGNGQGQLDGPWGIAVAPNTYLVSGTITSSSTLTGNLYDSNENSVGSFSCTFSLGSPGSINCSGNIGAKAFGGGTGGLTVDVSPGTFEWWTSGAKYNGGGGGTYSVGGCCGLTGTFYGTITTLPSF